MNLVISHTFVYNKELISTEKLEDYNKKNNYIFIP